MKKNKICLALKGIVCRRGVNETQLRCQVSGGVNGSIYIRGVWSLKREWKFEK